MQLYSNVIASRIATRSNRKSGIYCINFSQLLGYRFEDCYSRGMITNSVLKAKGREKVLFVDFIAGRRREKEREKEREGGKKNRGATNCRSCHWPALRAALIVYYQKALTSVHMVDRTSELQLRSVGATVHFAVETVDLLNAIYCVNE